MSRSDVFDAYAKIALEKGLIKASEESKDLKNYKNDSYPRAGSDTIEIIESLYGVKPETQKYKNNIMEIAHPDKVILSPAYDKINALVENNIERQKIMINITQKPVNGYLTQHKYATDELATSLMKVANDMDNRDMEEIRLLADACLEQLHKQAFDWDDIKNFFKERSSDVVDVGEGAATGAIVGGVIGGLVGIFGGPPGMVAGAAVGATSGAALAALFKTGPQAKNVSINAQVAMNKLAPIVSRMKNDQFLIRLYRSLQGIISTASQYGNLIDKANSPGAQFADKQAVEQLGLGYQVQIHDLDKAIDVFLANLKTGRYADAEESDIWSKIKSPITGIFGGEIHDVQRAMEQLELVNDAALKGIVETRKTMSAAKQEQAEAPKTEFSPIKPPTSAQPVSAMDRLKQYEEALKGFSQ